MRSLCLLIIRIIGLCLLQNEICPLFLNRHVLKYILGRTIAWHDLAFFDPVIYESLRTLVAESETKDGSLMMLDLSFTIELCAEEVSGDGALLRCGVVFVCFTSCLVCRWVCWMSWSSEVIVEIVVVEIQILQLSLLLFCGHYNH